MHKSVGGSDWTKLCDIITYPDIGDDPEILDTASLSDATKTSILGIQEVGGLTFEANYDKVTFTALKALERLDEQYALWFGGTPGGATPYGESGKFIFSGQLCVRATGGGVNESLKMSIMIAPSSSIVQSILSALLDNDGEIITDSNDNPLMGLYT